MSIYELINKLNEKQVKVSLVNGDLKIKAPKGVLNKELIDLIKDNKSGIIDFVLKFNSTRNSQKINLTEKREYYPVSSVQRRLYLLHSLNEKSLAYNISRILNLGKEVSENRIEDIFKFLINRHECLRTSFHVEGGGVVQKVHEFVNFKIEKFKLSNEEFANFKDKFRHNFNLTEPLLLRAGLVETEDNSNYLIIDIHHIISDASSNTILEKDFSKVFQGQECTLNYLQYKDYSAWQNSSEQKTKLYEQKAYWLDQLSDELPILNLPIDYPRPAKQEFEGASVSFVLSKTETQALKNFSQSNNYTLYMSILSALNILLWKLSGQEDIIVGSPSSGRSHIDLEKIVGMFVSTLAIRSEIKGDNNLRSYLDQIKKKSLEAFDNQDYQFDDLVDELSLSRDISRNPIFDVMFNLLNSSEYMGDLSGIDNAGYIHKSGISKFDLSLIIVDHGSNIILSFDYCTKLFKAETIERYISYLLRIIKQLPNKLNESLSSFNLLSAEEREFLLYELNDTQLDYSKNNTIHQLFEQQVIKTPDNIAVVYNDQVITYSELNKRSNLLAHYLRNKGISNNSVVSLYFAPSFEMLIGIFGVLKSGATYLPINTELPADRIRFMLYDSGSNIVLTHNMLSSDNLPETDIINLENILFKEEFNDLIDINNDFESSYIIYTSGTTGKPKGVLLSHQNLLNYFTWFNKKSKLDSNDKTALVTSYAFDLGYTGLYSSLINGSQLHLLPKERYLSPSFFVNYIIKNNITYLKLTSSLYTIFMDDLNFEKALINLKLLVLGGEKINVDAVKRTISINEEIQIINHYGPTEGTIGCISFNINKYNINNYKNRPVIGKPINNTNVYILNNYDKIQPIGVSGELCISGDGLAVGYINNPELTSEKFIDHPFKKGERLYRTGDLACCLPDKNIEFLGRIDNQIKIRGFRIELGEIESILQKHDKINDTVVIAREETGDKYLCAYIVSDEDINQEEIRAYLSLNLPDYMIPSYFVQQDKIPLTTNGKVNYKALPSPEVKAGDDYVAPSTETEKKLVEIWSEVLKIEKEEISVTVNFFSIGGNSLIVLKLSEAVKQNFDVQLYIVDYFDHNSIKTLADLIISLLGDKKDDMNTEKKEEHLNNILIF